MTMAMLTIWRIILIMKNFTLNELWMMINHAYPMTVMIMAMVMMRMRMAIMMMMILRIEDDDVGNDGNVAINPQLPEAPQL